MNGARDPKSVFSSFPHFVFGVRTKSMFGWAYCLFFTLAYLWAFGLDHHVSILSHKSTAEAKSPQIESFWLISQIAKVKKKPNQTPPKIYPDY